MTLDTSIRILRFACAGTVLYAIALILGLFLEPFAAFNNFFVDIAHMPMDGAETIETPTERLFLAIFAGLMVGFAGFVWQITTHVYSENPTLGAKIMIPAVLAWYIPDGIGSLIAGAWFNVVMNTFFLALFLLPVLLSQKVSQRTQAA